MFMLVEFLILRQYFVMTGINITVIFQKPMKVLMMV